MNQRAQIEREIETGIKKMQSGLGITKQHTWPMKVADATLVLCVICAVVFMLTYGRAA